MTVRSSSKIRLFMALLLAVTLGGCGVRFNQLETARRLVPDLADRGDALAAYAWTLSFHGSAYTVYPVEARGRQVLFANGDGLRLRWDGESIIVLEGLPGAFGRYESGIESNRAERWYAQPGRPLMRARCSGFRDWRLREQQSGWRQECSMDSDAGRLNAYHAVEFDGAGMITAIHASIVPGGAQFSLRRNR